LGAAARMNSGASGAGETEWVATKANLDALSNLSGAWNDRVAAFARGFRWRGRLGLFGSMVVPRRWACLRALARAASAQLRYYRFARVTGRSAAVQ
jgi:hypothetical protein